MALSVRSVNRALITVGVVIGICLVFTCHLHSAASMRVSDIHLNHREGLPDEQRQTSDSAGKDGSLQSGSAVPTESPVRKVSVTNGAKAGKRTRTKAHVDTAVDRRDPELPQLAPHPLKRYHEMPGDYFQTITEQISSRRFPATWTSYSKAEVSGQHAYTIINSAPTSFSIFMWHLGNQH